MANDKPAHAKELLGPHIKVAILFLSLPSLHACPNPFPLLLRNIAMLLAYCPDRVGGC
jgi:hypothetical protein